jgi:hypothetical protein
MAGGSGIAVGANDLVEQVIGTAATAATIPAGSPDGQTWSIPTSVVSTDYTFAAGPPKWKPFPAARRL